MHLPSRLPELPSGLRVQISDVLRRKLLRAPENMTIGGAPDCSSSHGRLFIGGKKSLARPPHGTAIATVVSRDQSLADAAHGAQGRTPYPALPAVLPAGAG